jgi:sodium transport system permease protein
MKSFYRTLYVILKKELYDALRDKRSLRLAFLPPLYFVGTFIATVFIVLHLKNEADGKGKEPIQLSVLGAEYLPPLSDWLQEQGLQIKPVGADAYEQVVQKKLNYALIIPKEAKQQFATGEPVVVWLTYDATNSKLQTSVNFIKQQIWSWNSRLGSLRLLSRGISPAIVNPVNLREMNIASDQKMGFFIMASVPMFLILSVFIASVGFTADMTAGERERRSLESLLITPASSASIIVAKWLTCLLLTFAVLLFELVLLAVAFQFMPFSQLGLRVDVSLLNLLGIFVALMSLVVIAVSLQQVISIFAKSFKDAQTYMGIIIFIPMLPMMYTLMNPGVYEPWFQWMPVLGHQAVVKDLLLGGTLDFLVIVKFWLVAVVISTVLLRFTANQLRKPRIVYS